MGIVDNSPSGFGWSLCRLDTESQQFTPGFSVTCSFLLRVNLHLFSATAATIHSCLDTGRRYEKESVNLVLPGVKEEHGL